MDDPEEIITLKRVSAPKSGEECDSIVKAIILGRHDAVGELCRILAESPYQDVLVAETAEELAELDLKKQSIRLAVLTDSFPELLTLELVNRLREEIDPVNIICLSTDDDQEQERMLRSAGLIFFGSYRNFFAFADTIINHTLSGTDKRGLTTKRSRERADSRNEDAKKLENRLSGSARPLKSKLKRTLFMLGSATAETVARCIEWTAALLITVTLTMPLFFILCCRKLFTGREIFVSQTIAGAYAKAVRVRRFNGTSAPWCDLPLFVELFTGRLALAGTAIREWSEGGATAENAYISMIKPGIVSLWNIRSASKIGHEGRLATEWEYVFKKELFYDFLLLLRSIPAMLYSETNGHSSATLHLLGLEVNNLTMESAVALIAENLEKQRQHSIFFVNPDCLNKMVSDREYFEILKTGDYLFPDGIGLTVAGKILQSPLRENINGTDMLPYLCRMAAEKGYSIFLLGGKPGIAETAGRSISEKFGVRVAGTAHGYFDHRKESESVIRSINQSGATLLLVAFGAPLQEKWIALHRHELTAGMLMGVGGLFDFYSGTIKRAPVWLREIGFEWVYRILQEPGRMWQRYVIGNPLFLFRVVKWQLFTQSRRQ